MDSEGNMIVTFPVFVKDYTSKPRTMYEIETIKVPIANHNKAAIQKLNNLHVIYWVVAATQHCRIAFTELDTNLGKNQKYRKY